jgi:hypothetical protein
MDPLPIGIRIHQRVIEAITIPVKILAVVGHLDIGVGADETPEDGIVNTAAHVN